MKNRMSPGLEVGGGQQLLNAVEQLRNTVSLAYMCGEAATLYLAARPELKIQAMIPLEDHVHVVESKYPPDAYLKGRFAIENLAVHTRVVGRQFYPLSYAMIHTPNYETFRWYGVLLGRTAINNLALQVGLPGVYPNSNQD